MLPDDVLLEIFDFYVDEDMGEDFKPQIIQEWITLAHVCRRWRSVIFQSPRRLNLRLLCTSKTPARDIQDIWPAFPLVISDFGIEPSSVDNIVAALEHIDRVCQIDLTGSKLEYVTDSAAMHKPFPELTHLRLAHLRLDSVLGYSLTESLTRLQSLILEDVPFPVLPKHLLSATLLVKLDLFNIPPSGYILPEAMATSLSALNRLESLRLHFRHPRPRPALGSRRQPPPPPTRSILPSLTKIRFKGASEYLEEILARIDAPRLNELRIAFFNQIIFDTPQLFQLISRRPTLRASERGHIEFNPGAIIVGFPSQTLNYVALSVEILCGTTEWQLSSLEQICTSSLPPVSTLEDLYIFEDQYNALNWQDDVENTLWLELLHPFTAVKHLYLCKEFVPRIAPALQELVGGRTTEVLPTLENIFLEGFQPSGPLHKGIEEFVAARRLTGTCHPVAVSRWDGNSNQGRRIHRW
ncbi:hypothetical protein F5888DRAFT_676722 [Russula emetica]|nr:hypothetical protein F5888DRAFT_676722 [Russula emetica]